LSKDNDACLAWLAEALRRLRPEGQEKVVGYLEAVLEEVLFETKMPPRPSGPSFGTEGLLRMGRGCLFWLLISVVLSVVLTVLANLLLNLF